MVKLTNYIIDLGRVVAYYPGLKKITGSTTSSILLCQFLYWTDKTKDDGWIYKTSDEIEEETGLTYNEQKTARKTLVDLELLEEELKRLDHTTRYRVVQETLNARWEEASGKKATPVAQPEIFPQPVTTPTPTKVIEKKGDLVDGIIALSQSPNLKKEQELDKIKEAIHIRLHLNPDNRRWQDFIEFVYKRQTKFNENIEKFIAWALDNGFSSSQAMYWSPEKMRTLWPQAFVEDDTNKVRDDFVQKLPERKPEVYAPMPKDIGRKQTLE